MIGAVGIVAFGSREGVSNRLGTEVTTVTGFGSSRDEGWLPGRIFILHTISMGLDNYPVPSEGRAYRDGIPEGFTHLPTEPCPFSTDGNPIGMLGSCCWLRGKAAARELSALHEDDLGERMYTNMSADEAISFARALLDAALRLEAKYADRSPKPKGAGWNGTWDLKRGVNVWATYSTFEEALASIREAAVWYEKVGKLGYGVHAWF